MIFLKRVFTNWINNEQYFYNSVFVILFVTIIFLSFKLRNSQRAISDLIRSKTTTEYRLEKYEYRYEQELFSENLKISDVHLVGLDNDSIYLSKLILSPTLIYRFSSKSCNPCVEEDIHKLHDLSLKIGKSNVLLISDFENNRQLINFIRDKKIDLKCYRYPGNFNLKIENVSQLKNPAFYFIMDKDMITQFVFYSDDYGELSKYYYNKIEEYFSAIN